MWMTYLFRHQPNRNQVSVKLNCVFSKFSPGHFFGIEVNGYCYKQLITKEGMTWPPASRIGDRVSNVLAPRS